ncbi:MAG TPA: DUF2786 domain-containing protein [Streptosporangiaceae bacterium]|nr:DUF2786 domain-containing protein [Streptosporangiaceae bacterium]
MTSEAPEKLLDRVRKLLAKAEAEGVTPPEAQALTAKAAELMARYGIDRALLAAVRPETDAPGSRLVELDNPWKRVKAHLLCGLGAAMRCQCILLTTRTGLKVHIFGYDSDIERTDVLYTSVLVQMSHGLATAIVPERASPRAWRRSWLLGFGAAVISRVKAAEQAAQARAEQAAPQAETGKSTALVLADRSLVIRAAVQREYPVTRAARTTYSGTGYGEGYEKGQRADLGTRRVTRPASPSLTRSGG